jgi:hypothetical protein
MDFSDDSSAVSDQFFADQYAQSNSLETTSAPVDVLYNFDTSAPTTPFVDTAGNPAPVPTDKTASVDALGWLGKASSSVIDFGNSLINLQGNASQLKIKSQAQQTQQAAQQANLDIQNAQIASARARALAGLTPVSGLTGTTQQEVMILGVIVIGAMMMAKGKA